MKSWYVGFLIALVLPAAAFAQTVDDEIRTQIEAQARAEGMTDAEINELVAALSAEATANGITAEDINPPASPVPPPVATNAEYSGPSPFVEQTTNFFGGESGNVGISNILAVLGGLALLGMLVMVWKKMEHGGAMGTAVPSAPGRAPGLAASQASPNPFPKPGTPPAQNTPASTQFPQHF